MSEKPVERWRRKNAERDQREGRTDWGALLPCDFCGDVHEPGTCVTGLDADIPTEADVIALYAQEGQWKPTRS